MPLLVITPTKATRAKFFSTAPHQASVHAFVGDNTNKSIKKRQLHSKKENI